MYFFKLSWGSVWGSGGVSWGSGGAVWLEKPIDSMTWRLSPAPVFLLGPISARLGPQTAEFCSGEARKNGV